MFAIDHKSIKYRKNMKDFPDKSIMECAIIDCWIVVKYNSIKIKIWIYNIN